MIKAIDKSGKLVMPSHPEAEMALTNESSDGEIMRHWKIRLNWFASNRHSDRAIS